MAAGIEFQKIIKYRITAVCTQPLHIGSALGDKEEVLIHPVDDIPFIQAASIAGILREYYTQGHSSNQADALFGARKSREGGNSMENTSRIRISDGKFCEDCLYLELRPRVQIDPKTGSCGESTIKGTDIRAGHKFNMEYIGAGSKFIFEIYLYDDDRQEDIEEILAALHQEQVQVGGQKSNGCGYMSLEGVRKKVFDMTSAPDRKLWAVEEELEEEEYEDILSELKAKEIKKRTNAYDITVNGYTEGDLLVKSIAVSEEGDDISYCTNLRNAQKDYIVPGSSLKGALRSQMERIAGYLGRPDIIQNTFGYTGKAGNIIVHDTVIGSKEENDRAEITHRLHIDKFTGGAIDGGLFHEKNISGSLEIHISIKDRNDPDRTCGLLLMALRDLAIGVMNVGSGYNVGKGIVGVSKIIVKTQKKDQEAVISFEENQIEDQDQIISSCIKALQGERKESTAV